MADDLLLNLPAKLRDQLARVAKKIGRSPESVVIDILEQELPRKELMANFVREALASDTEVESGGAVYRADEVHAWMERLAKGEKPPRPTPRTK